MGRVVALEVSARAPGRVNLIGEHTDYHGGPVLPMAIELTTEVRLLRRNDRRLVLRSTAYPDAIEVAVDDMMPRGGGCWSDYVRGVVASLLRAGFVVPGADVAIDSAIPEGAGLSSSAALEVATALAFLELTGAELDARALARLCQTAEHEFAGTRCGLMDPLASLLGASGHALRIDCARLEVTPVLLPPEVAIVVADTGVRHALATGAYNRRRAECELALQGVRARRPELTTLAELGAEELARLEGVLDPVSLARARHVVGECARVEAMIAALAEGRREDAGRVMVESHLSLRDDYAVSCAELDLLVELALETPGVFGSRMTGGGFGGSTVSLVDRDRAGMARSALSDAWRYATGKPLRSWIFAAGPGALALRDLAVT